MKKLFILLIPVLWSCGSSYTLEEQTSGTESLLIGLHAIDDNVVWASGTNATVIRSLDGGQNWEVFTLEGADTLQFRDIQGLSSTEAVVMSAGDGAGSRMFKFNAETNKWSEHYVMENPEGFLDCMAFWDEKRGVAYGDTFDGFNFIMATEDGGETWNRIPNAQVTIAGYGEGGFAASGTCLRTGPNGLAWIGTGAEGNSRVIYTKDYGKSWSAWVVAMNYAPFSGIASVGFLNEQQGFIAGGDMMNDSTYQRNLMYTTDGGVNWRIANTPETVGAFYGSSFVTIKNQNVTLISGPKGADISFDEGNSWENISEENLWTNTLLPSGTGWLMGKEGKILKIQVTL